MLHGSAGAAACADRLMALGPRVVTLDRMTRWASAAIVLIALAVGACAGPTAPNSLIPSVAPTSSARTTPTISAPTGAPQTTGQTASPQPTEYVPEYTPFPDPPGTFADCRPYAHGAAPTPTPGTDATPGPTFDAGALIPCGRDEWRQALDPVVRAIGRDKRNFCDGYFPVTVVQPGPWRLVINVVDGGDPAARNRVEKLIQPGAPVEWRPSSTAAAQLERLKHGPLLRAYSERTRSRSSQLSASTSCKTRYSSRRADHSRS